ncbi:large subunit ribosomal protein L31e [Chaetoceros tenuissimus]|uniref:Large subunit ribosomal protein L31e n=1 Tax=Chaetoceros tenuissimus TaxID=426638 RepID=A0AAD3DB07_9STRA|nr:large subunit ribosomal protein L31e [Chaetoceros tenuissimus]
MILEKEKKPKQQIPTPITLTKFYCQRISIMSKPDLVSRDYTIHLAKYTHRITFKKKAPRAIKEIKKFAQKAMGTKDIRIDAKLNKFIWSRGVKNVPNRVRVRLSRKRNEDDESDEQLYTLAQLVEVDGFKGLQTETVNA